MFSSSNSNKIKLSEAFLGKVRQLRVNATEAEIYLWSILRNRKLNGLKFRRQHPLLQGFILDFYCDELKLAIELDGGYHNTKEQVKYDELRTIEINYQLITVIRFKNSDVLDNTEYVLNRIIEFQK